MDWFSEKFMEDCIAEAPEAFLGKPLQLRAQQPRLGGFIPDLLFVDRSGASVIVEVQKQALDRYHLYKCLEYRDLLAASEGGMRPEVILVCEAIPEKYKNIAATHGVNLLVFTKEEVIDRAISSCPRALKSHIFLPEDVGIENIKEYIPSPIQRYAWSRYDSLIDVYEFFIKEENRCGIFEKLKKSGERSHIIWIAKHLLDGEKYFSRILNPTYWRIDNIVEKPGSWTPPHLEGLTRIRKPKITICVFVTSKDNLSVRWFPKDADQWNRSRVHDWVEAPATEPYAYQRPENELLFIKEIRNLSTNVDQYTYFEDGDERAAINTILISLVWAMIKYIQKSLSESVDVEMLSEFQIVVGDSLKSEFGTPKNDVAGWRVISADDIALEEANERILRFESKNGVSIDVILQTLREQLGRSKPPSGDRSTYLAKALRMKGHKITASSIRQLLDDFIISEYAAYRAFK